MKLFSIAIALFGSTWIAGAVSMADAAPCLIMTLTGTQSGPSVFNGQAGAGTLVRYGDDGNDCAAMKLQFDAGRGTNMRPVTDRCDSNTAECDLLYSHARRSHGGFCRRYDAALVLQGTKDRCRLQFGCHIRSGGHQQLPKICHAYCRCLSPVRRDRRTPLRGHCTARGRTSRFDERHYIRSDG